MWLIVSVLCVCPAFWWCDMSVLFFCIFPGSVYLLHGPPPHPKRQWMWVRQFWQQELPRNLNTWYACTVQRDGFQRAVSPRCDHSRRPFGGGIVAIVSRSVGWKVSSVLQPGTVWKDHMQTVSSEAQKIAALFNPTLPRYWQLSGRERAADPLSLRWEQEIRRLVGIRGPKVGVVCIVCSRFSTLNWPSLGRSTKLSFIWNWWSEWSLVFGVTFVFDPYYTCRCEHRSITGNGMSLWISWLFLHIKIECKYSSLWRNEFRYIITVVLLSAGILNSVLESSCLEETKILRCWHWC
jgi:hypothetical protein